MKMFDSRAADVRLRARFISYLVHSFVHNFKKKLFSLERPPWGMTEKKQKYTSGAKEMFHWFRRCIFTFFLSGLQAVSSRHRLQRFHTQIGEQKLGSVTYGACGHDLHTSGAVSVHRGGGVHFRRCCKNGFKGGRSRYTQGNVG